MKKIISVFTVLISLQVGGITSANTESDADRAASCSTYARNQAESTSEPGRSTLGSGLRGAAGGALFGALIDGGKGAGRGAAIAGGLGLLSGSMRGSQDRESNYRYYYESCMRGKM
ncbi:hypothetical protein [Desulfopila sp. IMCC35008]|uniref:hypothetical protein n=1 Tax=Desulfopila sp. IMCC35008 TaxID=2653858 RepID=UPI0013D22C39|nr:hypothetical protein [Desulfopila sp. IMCC35008]